jgi:hypothetical protein
MYADRKYDRVQSRVPSVPYGHIPEQLEAVQPIPPAADPSQLWKMRKIIGRKTDGDKAYSAFSICSQPGSLDLN